MKRFSVNIDFEVNDNITREQFEEWFKYEIIDWSSCSGSNPLINKDKNDLVSTYNITEY